MGVEEVSEPVLYPRRETPVTWPQESHASRISQQQGWLTASLYAATFFLVWIKLSCKVWVKHVVKVEGKKQRKRSVRGCLVLRYPLQATAGCHLVVQGRSETLGRASYRTSKCCVGGGGGYWYPLLLVVHSIPWLPQGLGYRGRARRIACVHLSMGGNVYYVVIGGIEEKPAPAWSAVLDDMYIRHLQRERAGTLPRHV
ncbi:hypothetical protein BD289DRAFT_433249 [Coniella lustricola]|uniref:Uncharacterized protein n=1 Tax=Coniella lustricola TaxID=2025994 RepID=A0A2T3A8Y8_9PEZI|nr:hypothetical protein BD289DRAFT_433249 [Coniella lustricola]